MKSMDLFRSMQHTTILEGSDTYIDVISKMSLGNPGSIGAMMDLMTYGAKIDPQAGDPSIFMLFLDSWGIYGTDIYVLWNDKCQCNTRKFMVLLRAAQFGFLPLSKLIEMSKDQMRQVDLSVEEWERIDKEVCEQLEEFKKAD